MRNIAREFAKKSIAVAITVRVVARVRKSLDAHGGLGPGPGQIGRQIGDHSSKLLPTRQRLQVGIPFGQDAATGHDPVDKLPMSLIEAGVSLAELVAHIPGLALKLGCARIERAVTLIDRGRAGGELGLFLPT
jgi:hypothetical protein